MEDEKKETQDRLSDTRCAVHAATQLRIKEEKIEKSIALQRSAPVRFGGRNPPLPSRTITITIRYEICPVCGLVYNLTFPHTEDEE